MDKNDVFIQKGRPDKFYSMAVEGRSSKGFLALINLSKEFVYVESLSVLASGRNLKKVGYIFTDKDL